jgi:hypothetical protein
VVQDGAPELWTVLSAALRKEPSVRTWQEVYDGYHLDERLGHCLDLCLKDATLAQHATQRRRWHNKLLGDARGFKSVLGSLKRYACRLDPDDKLTLAAHRRFLRKQSRRSDYARCRQNGVPIGSGVTEGACKSLVGIRAKRSGQRWSHRGLTAALHLREVVQNNRFDPFWRRFAQRYRAASMRPI